MIRAWRELWGFLAALGLALAIVARWRRGQVVMVSSTAAPAIRLLALLIVFVQGCADRLRGKDEGAGAGGSGSGASAGAGAGESGASAGAGAGGSESGASAGAGAGGADAAGIGTGDVASAGSTDAVFPVTSEEELASCFRALQDRGWEASPYKRFVRLLAPVAEGTGPNDPAWDELLRAADELGHDVRDPGKGEALAKVWRVHVEGRRQGTASTLAELVGLLDAAEALPFYDAWLAAYVWRRAAPVTGATAAARAELLARVERHARVHHALLKGQASTGPVEFTAWRSKAAPPRGWSGVQVPAGLLKASREAYATIDAGTWERAGTLALTVGRAEGLTLVRRGQAIALAEGQALVLRRLDLLQARGPALLRHAALGDMSLGAGAVASAWDIGERVAPAGRAEIRYKVAAALAGDAAALRWLEGVLPAAHAEIRRAVAEKPGAKGAAGLRMALALFDE